MNDSLVQFTITAFVMLIVVINPVAVAPVFVGVTRGMSAAGRRSVLNRAVLVAFGVYWRRRPAATCSASSRWPSSWPASTSSRGRSCTPATASSPASARG